MKKIVFAKGAEKGMWKCFGNKFTYYLRYPWEAPGDLWSELVFYKDMVVDFCRWGWFMRKVRWWDSQWMYRPMHKWLDESYQLHIDRGNSVNSHKYGKQMMVAKNLLQRIMDDEYTTPWDNIEPTYKQFMHKGCRAYRNTNTIRENALLGMKYKRQNELLKHDLDYLGKLIAKHSKKWWD